MLRASVTLIQAQAVRHSLALIPRHDGQTKTFASALLLIADDLAVSVRINSVVYDVRNGRM
jgi:hypothetical protein